jgi:hypothetical protein
MMWYTSWMFLIFAMAVTALVIACIAFVRTNDTSTTSKILSGA